MKQTVSLILLCAMLLALAACARPAPPFPAAPEPGSAGVPREPDESPAPPEPVPPEPDPLPPLPDNAAWAVEPTLTLDCLAPSALARGDGEAFYNTCGLISPDGLSEAVIDGKYGLLDHDGRWVVPCAFDVLFCGRGGKYALTKYGQAEGDPAEDSIYEPGAGLRRVGPDETNPDGSGVLVSITGTAMNPILCYVPERDAMYNFSDATVWPIYDDADRPDYPTRALLFNADEYNTDNGTWLPKLGESDCYVLTDGRRPVSDERYQNIGCVAEGIVPACKSGGKWGYLDTAGQVVIPFVYDDARLYYTDWDYENHVPLEEGIVLRGGAFQATEGTVVLRQGETSALFTTAGEEILPFGVFEELLPLHEGRLWAKYGGKWGVLALQAP